MPSLEVDDLASRYYGPYYDLQSTVHQSIVSPRSDLRAFVPSHLSLCLNRIDLVHDPMRLPPLVMLAAIAGSRAMVLPVRTIAAVAGAVLSLSPGPSTPTTLSSPLPSSVLLAKEELPSLERCFNAVRRELGAEGESLRRLEQDIDRADFKDIILFTREYDAGFRGGVLKSAWKQMGDETKRRGIEVSNSFTFDLIALNKAARSADEAEARRCLGLVRQDLVDFLALEKNSSPSAQQ